MRGPLTLQNAPQLPADYDKDSAQYQSDLARWTADTSDFLRSTPFDKYSFVYVPETAGAPTQTPQGLPNRVPLDIDITNSLLYYYWAGAWHSIGGGGGGSGTVTSITATTPIVVTPSPITTTGVISHANSGVTASTYGDATDVPQITVDVKGHVTGVVNVPIGSPGAILTKIRPHWAQAAAGAASFQFFGISGIQTIGNINAVALTNTNYFTQNTRLQSVCSSAHTSFGGFRSSDRFTWIGNASGLGGFTFSMGFGLSTVLTSQRVFCGLWNSLSNIGAAVEPSALTDCIFMACDSTDTTWQIMNNDASGSCTKTNTGFSSTATASTDWYRFSLTCLPNASSITYLVEQMNTGSTFSGTLSTNLPTNSNFMAWWAGTCNGGNGAGGVIGIDSGFMTCESVY